MFLIFVLLKTQRCEKHGALFLSKLFQIHIFTIDSQDKNIIILFLSYRISPHDGRDDAAATAMVTELAEVNALPRAQIQTAAGDGDGQPCADEDGLGVCRHVVVALQDMLVIGLAFPDQAVEDGRQIRTHVRVGIFTNGQSAAGVLDEEVDQTGRRKHGQMTDDFVRDQVEAPRTGAKGKLYLLYHNRSMYVMVCLRMDATYGPRCGG